MPTPCRVTDPANSEIDRPIGVMGQRGGGDEDENGGRLIPPDKAPFQNIRRIASSHIYKYRQRQFNEEGEF